MAGVVLGLLGTACDGDTARRAADGGVVETRDAAPPAIDAAASDAATADAAVVDAPPVDAAIDAPPVDAAIDATATDATVTDAPPVVTAPPNPDVVFLAAGDEDEPLRPAIVMTPDGGALAAWTAFQHTYARRFVPAAGWQPAVAIDAGSAVDTAFVQLAVSPDGAVAALWNAHGVWSNRHVPGAGWGTAVRLDDAVDGNEYHLPALAAGPDGELIAVWTQSHFGNDAHVWARRFVPGDGWSPRVMLASGAHRQGWPSVAIDAHGNAVAAWTQDLEQGQGREVWAASYSATGWTPATRLRAANAGYAYGTRVAFDVAGHAAALWNARAIEAARLAPGVGWGPVESLESPSGADLREVALAPAHGTFVAAWRAGSTLHLRRATAGGWTPIETIATGAEPQLAVGSNGDLLVAYTDGDVRLAREVGGGWSAPGRLDGTTSTEVSPYRPALAASATGAIVVWEEHHWHSGYPFRAYAAGP